MHFLFPSDNAYTKAINLQSVDPIYLPEYYAASSAGITHLYNPQDGKTNLPYSLKAFKTPLIYYGSPLSIDKYTTLYHLADIKGYRLINAPIQYFGCHHFDNWYPYITDMTPHSIIIERTDIKSMLERVLAFQKKIRGALVLRDSVQMLRHLWKEATIIPTDADEKHVGRILETFFQMKERYGTFQGSLIAREYIPLKQIGTHPSCSIPISYELRGYVMHGKLIYACPYWDDTTYTYEPSRFPMQLFEEVASEIYATIKSKFFSIDIAKMIDGNWACIDVGDGQVSILPDSGDKEFFFKQLAEKHTAAHW